MSPTKTESLKPILVALHALNDAQLRETIAKLEAKRKLQFPDRARLLLAHNVLNERIWQRNVLNERIWQRENRNA